METDAVDLGLVIKAWNTFSKQSSSEWHWHIFREYPMPTSFLAQEVFDSFHIFDIELL
jgi:hypothetical protein